MKKPLVEHIDFYYNEQGYMVFTEKFHLERGYCCGNGCKHCPYNYEKVPEPKRSALLKQREENSGESR
ncbi:DUF5522 domain-containing protein [Chitinophaga terrae (ex Kim and Jung 2007)]|uniref:DUF5522 domain-containing protein n=1 Tax=Chitinophaga terrae (ex Kim and Jung 2007) TaxID=408074 RepID=UPI000B7EB18E|nr:DUF5522 domain-containing protein [Chitinophaga terrae (ex Kim and Jung 2007)]